MAEPEYVFVEARIPLFMDETLEDAIVRVKKWFPRIDDMELLRVRGPWDPAQTIGRE